MEVKTTNIKGCYVIKLDYFGDHRGGFMETFSEEKYKNIGIPYEYVQDNMSYSVHENVFRGLHCQKEDHSQGKLVSCSEGEVADYIVDIRKNSPTYMNSERIMLSKDNHVQVYVPEGCLHGFEVLKAPATFNYKVTRLYNKEADAGVLCTDPDINLPLPDLEKMVLSEKDQNLPRLKDSNIEYKYMPRCLVTGAITGQLGPEVVEQLKTRGYRDIYALDKETVDLTDEKKVKETILRFQPDVIFHCAAYTDVDGAQRNKELANKINKEGTKYIVQSAKEINAKVIYISTDYVFSGKEEGIYETNSETNPQSVYGETKLAGEKEVTSYDKHFVVRTSWVFGGINTKNFVKTMLELSDRFKEITVVNDQFGSPTYAKDLAKFLIDMSETDKYGIYHANNEGYCSWNEFANKIFELASKETVALAVSTKEYYGTDSMKKKIRELASLKETVEITEEIFKSVIAPRPLNSKLSKECLVENGFDKLRHWEDATSEYVKKLELHKMERGN